jgi:two-component sensor histidine kinase
MRKIILLFAAVIFSCSIYCQQNQIDSLHKLLHNTMPLHEKEGQIRDLTINSLKKNNPLKTMSLAFETAKVLTNYNKRFTPLAELIICEAYSIKGNSDSSFSWCKKAYASAQIYHDKTVIINSANYLRYFYSLSGDQESAVKYGLAALKLSESAKSNRGIAIASMNLGHSYKALDNISEAIKYYRQAYVYSVLDKNPTMIPNSLISIGNLFNKQELYDSAIAYYNEAKNYSEKAGEKNALATVLANIGDYYSKLNSPDSAVYYFNKSSLVADQVPNIAIKIYALKETAKITARKGDFTRSNDSLLKALSIAMKSNVTVFNLDIDTTLSKNYLRLTDTVKAYYYLALANDISKSSFNKEKEASDLLSAYQEEQNKNKILRLNLLRLKAAQAALNMDIERKQALAKAKEDSIAESKSNAVARLNAALAKNSEQKRLADSNASNAKILLVKNNADNERKIKNYFILGTIASIMVAIFILYLLLNKRKQNKALAKERAVVSNLAGIMKHETARQFSNLSISLQKILSVKEPKLQVSKAIVEVKSNALLYSSLFISGEKALISFKKTAEELFTYNYSRNLIDKDVGFEVTGDVNLNIHGEEYLFQYLNELISNSLEHAFKNTDKPVIKISIEQTRDNTIIEYQDNGCGITNFDELIKPGKGMYYIKLLAEDNMNAELNTNFSNGSKFILTLPNTTA